MWSKIIWCLKAPCLEKFSSRPKHVSVCNTGQSEQTQWLCRIFRNSSCCCDGAASKQATHRERGSEECFLLDCLSCPPHPPPQTYCVCVCVGMCQKYHYVHYLEYMCVFVCVSSCSQWVYAMPGCGFSTYTVTTNVVVLSQWLLFFLTHWQTLYGIRGHFANEMISWIFDRIFIISWLFRGKFGWFHT